MVTFAREQETLTAFLEGEIDHHTASGMREAIDKELTACRPKTLHLDFGGIGFMDSSGIGLVMGRYQLMRELGGQVKVVNSQPAVGRLMRLAGLERLDVL